MAIPPLVVNAARQGWKWQWSQLMNGLAPADKSGNYLRPTSQHLEALIPQESDLAKRSREQLPTLIIGRSCPWAHRTWLIHQLRKLNERLSLLVVHADHKAGQWSLEPPWLGCNSLFDLYKRCGTPPSHRATVPVIVDPGATSNHSPKILGNESAQLVEALNEWPSTQETPNFLPLELKEKIDNWQKVLQPAVNDGVYRCGFARNQFAYERASNELFETLEQTDKSLANNGPWLCGEKLTLADIRLFPTLIRWEVVYQPLFNCSKKPLWEFSALWEWRQRLFAIPSIAETCDAIAWRKDYFGALFPLRPSNIVPAGPDLAKMIEVTPPKLL